MVIQMSNFGKLDCILAYQSFRETCTAQVFLFPVIMMVKLPPLTGVIWNEFWSTERIERIKTAPENNFAHCDMATSPKSWLWLCWKLNSVLNRDIPQIKRIIPVICLLTPSLNLREEAYWRCNIFKCSNFPKVILGDWTN